MDIFVFCLFVGVAYFIVNVKYLCSTVGIRGVVIQSLPRIPPGQGYEMHVVCYMLYDVHLGLS